MLYFPAVSFAQVSPAGSGCKATADKDRSRCIDHTGAGPAKVDPVIVTRAAPDDKIVTLRVAPLVGTSIRLPEPVNSVVVGDSENFHHHRTAETNLLITTTPGHQVNLLLISSGERGDGAQTVDVLLRYGKPAAGSFLIEENPVSSVLIAETQSLGAEARNPKTPTGRTSATLLAELVRSASLGGSSSTGDMFGQALDKLLARQGQAPLPMLWTASRGNRGRTARQGGCRRSSG
jgi:hypothetical protein